MPPQSGFPRGGDPRRRPGAPSGPYGGPGPYGAPPGPTGGPAGPYGGVPGPYDPHRSYGPPPQQPGYPPYPGPQQPAHQPPGGPPPSNNRQWLLLGGAGVVILVLVVALVAVLASGGSGDDKSAAPTTTAAAPPTGGDDSDSTASTSPTTSTTASSSPSDAGTSELAGLLEPAGKLNDLMKMTMTASPSESGTAPLTSVTVTPSECTRNLIPATAAVYAGVDYSEIAVQGFRGPGKSVKNSVIEAVVRFPDADAAKRFFNDQYADMSNCTYKPVSAAYGDGATLHGKTAAVGKSSETDGEKIMTTMFPNLRNSGEGCNRSLGLKADIVVDVVVCREDKLGASGTTLVGRILRNIS